MSQFGSPAMTSRMVQHGLPMSTAGEMQNGGMNMNAMAMGTFDQTFNNVPQDLWKMPMTLEWDWADMTGYNGFEDGISMNGVLPDFGHQTSHGTSGFNSNAMNGGR